MGDCSHILKYLSKNFLCWLSNSSVLIIIGNTQTILFLIIQLSNFTHDPFELKK